MRDRILFNATGLLLYACGLLNGYLAWGAGHG